MKTADSVSEAKAKLSQILRRVREWGVTAALWLRDKPLTEVRPVEPEPRAGLEAGLAELARRGAIAANWGGTGGVRVLAIRPGALARFLRERGR